MARAPINGQTLRWARTASHLDQGALAKAAGVTAERIAEFEAGTAAPTFRQLTLMATKLDRPWGFFFAAAPSVSDVPEAADFRGRDDPELSADIAREMRRAEQHREAMLDLTAPPDRAVGLDVISHESAAARARELRQRFGLTEHFIPPESQQNQVFNFWRGLLESYGFLIFQATKIDLDAFRGLSVHHDVLPIIVLNGADAASGKVFTLFHEVAHVANRKSGLCLLDDAVFEEEVANRFAANFLMPEMLIRQHLIATSDPVELAAHVASTLKVSSLAAGVRLRTLELISEEDLRSIRQESAETWRLAREAQKTSDGFVPPWRLRYRDLGANYIGTVARALEDRRIDAMDATYLLNARWPMVEQLFQEYYRTGGEA
jgi:Zn-dependent peptidase ImmA (M78 family)/transcriptional regulator with XRE-family HTH domain